MPTANCINANQVGLQSYDGAGTWNGRALVGANTGVVITNANGVAGNPAIAVVGMGLPEIEISTATQALASNTQYTVNRSGGVAFSLPTTATQGDIILIVSKLGLWSVTQAANQQIIIGIVATTAGTGGSISAAFVSDAVMMKCIVGGANTIWKAFPLNGNINYV